MSTLEKLITSRSKERRLEELSPFELKDNLIALAADKQKKSSLTMLNAGRGNPNWTATPPREAFYLLGQFALSECRRTMSAASGLSGIPEKHGIGKRLEAFLRENSETPGADLLGKV